MSNRTFEIGLVGAGAISAGAYTGGVVDFLVQALDQWYEVYGDKPPHDVKVSVFSGASAGAMTAALATAYMASDQPYVTTDGGAIEKNNLFESWVEKIDINKLLEGKDLPGKVTVVRSLLDSSVLVDIASKGLTPAREKKRPYIADNFELILMVTNLRGVPYSFPIIGNAVVDYDMSLHEDYIHIRINDAGNDVLPDRYVMKWSEFFRESSPVKDMLQLAALASGAFPIGLAPRTLRHTIPQKNFSCQEFRSWPRCSGGVDSTQCPKQTCCIDPYSGRITGGLKDAAERPADWGDFFGTYEFQCVDGGVMNNEPLELARMVLAGPGGRNERSGDKADKALLLIDPFPNNTGFDTEWKEAPDLAGEALSLLAALKNQARFKPEELKLAANENVFSRFMIAPSRDGKGYPIACGSLGGFGGFLKREFRAHDYFLGRRNAQKFLCDHFVLPESNALFDGWNDRMKQQHCVKDVAGNARLKDGNKLLPIIPLVGTATTACFQAPWPRYTEGDLERLRRAIEGRVDIVVDRLVSQYFNNKCFLTRKIAGWVIGRKKRDVVEFAAQKVAKELKTMKLM